MKTTPLISLLIVFSFSVAAQTAAPKWFSIKAFLPFWNGAVVTFTVDDQLVNRDTVKNDSYGFTGTANSIGRGMMEVKKGSAVTFVPLFIEPGTIKVRDKGHNTLEAFGTKTNNDYLRLKVDFDSLSQRAAGNSLTTVKEYKKNLAGAYIKKNPASVISLQLIKEYYYRESTNDSSYYLLTRTLDSSLKTSSLGRKVIEESAFRYRTATGMLFPEATLLDTALKTTTLITTSRYTLVNFWASWCIPCRKEHPALINLFRKYNAKGLNIISITMDSNVTFWREAIKRDGLTWNHVSDLKSWNGPAAKTYGVRRIPMNFLLDKDGKIIAKNLTPEGLAKKLKEMLDGDLFSF